MLVKSGNKDKVTELQQRKGNAPRRLRTPARMTTLLAAVGNRKEWERPPTGKRTDSRWSPHTTETAGPWEGACSWPSNHVGDGRALTFS